VKIRKLQLTNFMAYKGAHTIDFDVADSAPVILFLGENGHGKTTIQRACKWALYGEVIEKKEKIQIDKLVNRKALQEASGSEVQTSVQFEWEDEGISYSLHRSFSTKNNIAQVPKVVLRINNQNPEPEKAVTSIVNRILPKEISHFFFFDGETQDEFDRMASATGSADYIKQQIEATLSIPAVKSAIAALMTRKNQESIEIEKANRQNMKVAEATKKLNQIRAESVVLATEIGVREESLRKTVVAIDEIEKNLTNLDETQELMGEIEVVRTEKKIFDRNYKEKLDELRELLGQYPWIPLAGTLQSTYRSLKQDVETRQQSVDLVRSLQDKAHQLQVVLDGKPCPVCGAGSSNDKEDIAKQINDIQSELSALQLGGLTDDAAMKLQKFAQFNYDPSVWEKARDLLKEAEGLGADLAIASQSARDLDAKLEALGVVNVQNEIASLRARHEEKSQIERVIIDYHAEARVKQSEIDKLQNAIGKAIPESERHAFELLAYLSLLFEHTLDAYRTSVRKKVQDYASETFLDIISDKKYVGLRITDNFGVELLMPDGSGDPLRSTGQGKVSAIALVSGLIHTAMDEGFILMDTPFVSLDKGHRAAVCKWATESGFRVSLFMHSGEFEWVRDRKQFGDSVGRVYRIARVDDNESGITEGADV
jgi:DNA sulfur modification protein DndD